MTYGEGVLKSIMDQCELRGIPVEESESVLAYLTEEHGKSVTSMDERELRKVQMGLGTSMGVYLEGAKRRGESGGAWPNAEGPAIMLAAKGGITISGIEGSGKEGKVTAKDVKKEINARDEAE
jgi:hypothetical protein